MKAVKKKVSLLTYTSAQLRVLLNCNMYVVLNESGRHEVRNESNPVSFVDILETILDKHRQLVTTATPPPSPTHGESNDGSPSHIAYGSSPLQSGKAEELANWAEFHEAVKQRILLSKFLC